MKPRRAVWESEYKHDRRKHRHRCRCCRRIIEAGESVVMWKHYDYRQKHAYAVHAACAETRHSEAYTWREVIEVWGGPAPVYSNRVSPNWN